MRRQKCCSANAPTNVPTSGRSGSCYMSYQRAREVERALDAINRRRAWPVIGRLLISVHRRALYGATASAVLLSTLIAGGTRPRNRNHAVLEHRVSSVAVLPLANATSDPNATYYADGITDALITQLGAASTIRVFSPASAARVAGARPTPRSSGAPLGADVI